MKHSLLSLLVLAGVLMADQNGADPRLTGAPGDQNCTRCHSGTAVNGGGGSVAIQLPGGATYTPGVKQQLVILINDGVGKRFGFELTARLASDLTNGQAGSLAAVDSNAKVI